MARKRSAALSSKATPATARATTGDADRKAATPRARAKSVYSAQSIANFCDVDLKTVHHWADRGKVPHFRTEGRHLRFRRNDVVRFLRGHGYPLPDELVRARPTVGLALLPFMLQSAPLSLDEVVKRCGSRFAVRRHASSVTALTHLVADPPDALVLGLDDPAISCPRVIRALKADSATAFLFVAVIGAEESLAEARDAGAEIALATREVAKLTGELARGLAVF